MHSAINRAAGRDGLNVGSLRERGRMDPLRSIVDELHFFTRQHAIAAGYDDRTIAREVRARRWVRFRRGYYTFADIWASSTPEGQHLIRARAVLDSLGDAAVLSHVSACLVAGVDAWGLPLERVHVTRLDGGAGRIEADVVHHEGFVGNDEVVDVGGVRILRPARCVLEAASRGTAEHGLVLLNSALHKGLCTIEELGDQFDVMAYWPHMRHLHVPIRMCTSKAESVGESRGLWLFWQQHLPAPVLQHEVFDTRGILIGRTDWAWPKFRGLGEFDGKVKYGRLLKPGQDPGEAVFDEKRREDQLREATNSWMIRLVWSDFDIPSRTAARIRTRLAEAS